MILKKIRFYIGYFFYVLITVKDRSNYIHTQNSGYDCIDSHDDSYFLYDSSRKFYYDKNKSPKHYITYTI